MDGGNAVDFGDILYGVPQGRSAWILNSGRCNVDYDTSLACVPCAPDSVSGKATTGAARYLSPREIHRLLPAPSRLLSLTVAIFATSCILPPVPAHLLQSPCPL